MAWASVGTMGATSDKVAGTSIAHTVTATIEAGNVAVAVVAKDNAGTTDTNTNEITGITDSQGNTWVKAREFCNGNGSADTGAVVAIFYCIVATQLTGSSDVVTAAFSDSRTASAISVWEFTIGAGSTLSVAGTGDLANDAADPGSLGISGLASAEYLFVRGIASELSGGALTPTASHTAITGANTTGIPPESNMCARGEWIILTGTGDTSDPTLFSADHASTMVALLETAPPAGGQPAIIRSWGVPHARVAGFGGVRIGG